MSSLYEILGLPRSTNEQQIKAAYRTLARRFHPDVNADDETAEQRFKEVSRAYETLGDPQARAAYDRDLARRRAEAWRRYWSLAATGTATFLLTVSFVAQLPRLWTQYAGAPQPRISPDALAQGKGRGSEVAMAPLPGNPEVDVSPPRRQAGAANWTTYQNVPFGFALRYPAGVFASDIGQSGANVRAFVSRDGRAVLRIFAAENTAGTTPAKYRRALMEERHAGAVFYQAPQRKFWFAFSGTRGENVFYERITFSCDGRSIHGWQMVYPLTERASYDVLAKLVYRNYPHGNGPGARCGEGRQRPQAGRTWR